MDLFHVREWFSLVVLAASMAVACADKQPALDMTAEMTTDIGADMAAECSTDPECQTGFCDRGQCAVPVPQYLYGQQCTPAPIGPDGLRDGTLHFCGAYLCIDGRCRSCVSDEECKTEMGAPDCTDFAPRPGFRCGDAPP